MRSKKGSTFCDVALFGVMINRNTVSRAYFAAASW